LLDRIKLGQIEPYRGRFFLFREDPCDKNSIKEKLNHPETICEACAKGGLFLSYIGIVNNYDTKAGYINGRQENNSPEMQTLGQIFSKKQLSLIETAFEGDTYFQNVKLSDKEINRCYLFRGGSCDETDDSLENDLKILTKICNNIIKNNGEFIP
jgi:hypothetical protein